VILFISYSAGLITFFWFFQKYSPNSRLLKKGYGLSISYCLLFDTDLCCWFGWSGDLSIYVLMGSYSYPTLDISFMGAFVLLANKSFSLKFWLARFLCWLPFPAYDSTNGPFIFLDNRTL
jgi:hypothetical protein